MSTNTLFILELIIFNGIVLVWAFYELWSVRKRKDSSESGHAEGEHGAHDR